MMLGDLERELLAQEDINRNLAGIKNDGITIPIAQFERMVPLDYDALNWIKNRGLKAKEYINTLVHEQMKSHPES